MCGEEEDLEIAEDVKQLELPQMAGVFFVYAGFVGLSIIVHLYDLGSRRSLYASEIRVIKEQEEDSLEQIVTAVELALQRHDARDDSDPVIAPGKFADNDDDDRPLREAPAPLEYMDSLRSSNPDSIRVEADDNMGVPLKPTKKRSGKNGKSKKKGRRM